MATTRISRACSSSRLTALAALALACLSSAARAEPVREHKAFMTETGPRVVVMGRRRVQAFSSAGRPLKPVALDADVADAALSRDGALFAACLREGGLVVIDLDLGAVRKLEKDRFCADLSWTADGNLHYLTHRFKPGGSEPVVTVELRRLPAGKAEPGEFYAADVPIPMPVLPPPPIVLPGAGGAGKPGSGAPPAAIVPPETPKKR